MGRDSHMVHLLIPCSSACELRGERDLRHRPVFVGALRRPQLCPERFIRTVTRTLFAGSTAPEPIA